MSQPFFSESDTLLLLLRKEERLLLRTKWLQSRCSEELLDPLGCECHIISPLNMRTDCRKVSVALAFSVFYNCFPNRVGELCWSSATGFVEHSDVVRNPCVLGFLELVCPASHGRKITTHSLRDCALLHPLFPERLDLCARHVPCCWT